MVKSATADAGCDRIISHAHFGPDAIEYMAADVMLGGKETPGVMAAMCVHQDNWQTAAASIGGYLPIRDGRKSAALK